MVADLNKAVKDMGLQEPSCKHCQNHKHTYSQMPEGVHLAIPVYHVKGNRGAHIGLIARGCERCGFTEFFAEDTFLTFLGLPNFSHKKEKTD